MAARLVGFNYFEGLAADVKPTNVTPGSTYRETDTYLLYKTFDGDTWVLASNELYNLSVLEHHEHSRSRVYPQDVEETITLAATATADTFGSWTEIIPIDTVDFIYEVKGLVVEAIDAATTILIQLGYSIVDGSDPTTAQIMGERRLILPTPVSKATEILQLYSQNCPANAKLWGRLKTASGAADEVEISVVVRRHLEITNPQDMLATWPWST